MTTAFPIFQTVAGRWWVLLLRGIFAVLFGLLAFVWPGLTLAVLVLLFGAYALADGIVAIAVGAQSRWWMLLLTGALGVMAGMLSFFYPGITALALLYIIAFWAILRGFSEIVAAVQLRKVITNEWMLILGGAASVIFGVLLILFPGAGALSVIWLIGAYALFFGILMIGLALRLRSLPERLEALLG